jgi:hypothetical protein
MSSVHGFLRHCGHRLTTRSPSKLAKTVSAGKDANCLLEDLDMEAFVDPGYRDPVTRHATMDRDGVDAEVIYSEVSASRAYGLVPGD